MKLSVTIPCYNEENTIELILNKVLNNSYKNKEIIIVDDCSTDKTLEKLNKYKDFKEIRILKNYKNFGKGYCIREALKKVTGEITIIQDADLEYDPKDYNKLIDPIFENFADVVYGSRFIGSGPLRKIYYLNKIGNYFLTFLSNIFTNLDLTDMETCYKAIRTDKFKQINLSENHFGFEPEVTAKLAKLNCRFYEIGISYYGRTYEEGKKIRFKDGIRAIYCILRYNIFS